MGALVWDERLISRSRALAVAGLWPGHVEQRDGELHLCCDRNSHRGGGLCGQSMLRLGSATGPAYRVTVETVLAGVLRHAVMAHDVALSGATDGGRTDGRGDARRAGGRAAASQAARAARRRFGRRRDVATGDRPADQAADHRGGSEFEGGDCA